MILQIGLMVIGAFLSVVFTRIFIQNGRHIQQLEKIMEEHRIETNKLLEKISDQITKLGEQISSQITKLGELIVIESRSIKETIKESKS